MHIPKPYLNIYCNRTQERARKKMASNWKIAHAGFHVSKKNWKIALTTYGTRKFQRFVRFIESSQQTLFFLKLLTQQQLHFIKSNNAFVFHRELNTVDRFRKLAYYTFVIIIQQLMLTINQLFSVLLLEKSYKIRFFLITLEKKCVLKTMLLVHLHKKCKLH